MMDRVDVFPTFRDDIVDQCFKTMLECLDLACFKDIIRRLLDVHLH